MVRDEHITFSDLPAANRAASDPWVGKDIIDLHGRILHEAVIGVTDIPGHIDHPGMLGHVCHFLAVRQCVHIANEDAGGIREEGLFFHLLYDLFDAKEPCQVAYMIQVGVDDPEDRIRFQMVESGFRADPRAIALDLVSGAGNIGGGGEPIGIELHEVEPVGQKGDTGLFAFESGFPGTSYDVVSPQRILEPRCHMRKDLLEADDIGLLGPDRL